MANRNEVEIRVKFIRDGKVVTGVLGDLGKLKSLTGDVGSKAVFMGNMYTKAFESIVRGATAAARAIGATVQEGLRFNMALESSKYALSGLLFQFSDVEDTTERWTSSLSDAVDMQEQLKIMALQTAGTYEDLVSTIQTGLAPGLQAGLSPDQVAQIGLRVSQATSAMGLASHMSMQEMRALMTGAIDRNATIAKSLGITSADINRWKEAGTLFEELEGRMLGFARAAEEAQGSMGFLLSNIWDAFQQLSGNATEDAFETIKESLRELFDFLVQFDEKGKASFNEDLVEMIRSFANAFAGMVELVVANINWLVPALNMGSKIFFTLFGAISFGIAKVTSLLADFWAVVTETFVQPMLDMLRETLNEIKNILHSDWLKPFVKDAGLLWESLGGDSALAAIDTASAGAEKLRSGLLDTANGAEKAAATFKDLVKAQIHGWDSIDKARKKSKGSYGGADALDPEDIKKAQSELTKLIGKYDEITTAAERQAATLQLTNERARAIVDAEYERLEVNEWLAKQLDSIAELYVFDPALAESAAKQMADAYTAKIALIEQRLRQALIQPGLDLIEEKWNEIKSGGVGLSEVDPKINENVLAMLRERKEFEKVAVRFERAVTDVSDAIVAGFTEGADGFLRALGSSFKQDFPEMLDGMIMGLVTGVFGGSLQRDEASGAWGIVDAAGKFSKLTEKQTKAVQNFGQAVEIASAAASIYSSAQGMSKKDGAISGALSGAVAGFQIGNVVGAIVGAIAGAALGYFGGSDAKKYGFSVQNATSPLYNGLDQGASISGVNYGGPKGLDEHQIAAIEAQITEVRDAFWNAYVTIFLESGHADLLEKVRENLRSAPQIGDKATADFMESYDAWLNQTLPDAIADQFKDGMATIYTSIGLSAEKFEFLWKRFDALDPKKAVQMWSALLDALTTMDEVLNYFDRPGMSPGELPAFATWTSSGSWAMDRARGGMNQNFRASMTDMDEEILNLGAALDDLTGEAQIQAAQKLGSLMQQRMQAEIAYMEQLVNLSKTVSDSFAALRRSLTLDSFVDENGNADVNAQIQYLKDYLDQLYARIGTAQTPEELAQINSEIQQTMGQIYQLAGTVGPEFAAEIREWLMGEGGIMDILEGAMQARITALADDAASSADELIEALRPVWEIFTQSVGDAAGALGGVGDGSPGGGGEGNGPTGGHPGFVNNVTAAGEAVGSFAGAVTSAADSIAIVAESLSAMAIAAANSSSVIAQTAPPETRRKTA